MLLPLYIKNKHQKVMYPELGWNSLELQTLQVLKNFAFFGENNSLNINFSGHQFCCKIMNLQNQIRFCNPDLCVSFLHYTTHNMNITNTHEPLTIILIAW